MSVRTTLLHGATGYILSAKECLEQLDYEPNDIIDWTLALLDDVVASLLDEVLDSQGRAGGTVV